MPSCLSRLARAAMLAGAACVATTVFATSAHAADLEADFHFNDTLQAPTGQALSEIEPGTTSFADDSVNGPPPRRVLTFPAGKGLKLSTEGLAESGSYSVVMLFRLEPGAATRRKLLDFAGGAEDAGLYLCDGVLMFETLTGTACPVGPGFPAGYVQVVLTRASNGDVRAYLDGVEQVATAGAAVLGPELRFFRDDDGTVDEHAAGAVARIRFYEGVVSPTELAPETAIDSGPPPLTNGRTHTFAFSSPDPGARFECRHLGPGDSAFASCTSPVTLESLGDGGHVFEVRAVDPAGNPDGSAASLSFTVDATAPDTAIGSGPAGPTGDATPEFAFAASEPGGFECRHHRAGDAAPAFAPCGSPHTLGPLDEGSWVLEVAAIDAAGNRDGSPAARSFRVDTTPPQTEITGGPGDTTAANAVFLFSSPGAERFECRLDGGAWRPCDSPHSYSNLSLGPHRFEVKGIDEAGNEERAPAAHSWQVLRPGLVIPGALKQAIALASELVQMRKALARVRLRALRRRRAVTLKGFDALTGGTVELRARARVRRRLITILVGERDVPRAGRYPIRARVTRKGRRLMRGRRRLAVELRLSFTDLAGRSLWATTKLAMKR